MLSKTRVVVALIVITMMILATCGTTSDGELVLTPDNNAAATSADAVLATLPTLVQPTQMPESAPVVTAQGIQPPPTFVLTLTIEPSATPEIVTPQVLPTISPTPPIPTSEPITPTATPVVATPTVIFTVIPLTSKAVPTQTPVVAVQRPQLRVVPVSVVLSEFDLTNWRHWIDADGDSQNTQQEVLIAESDIPVSFESTEQCIVASGSCVDPYTGTVVQDPVELAVMHMVPLENAHRSGGWSWSIGEKTVFANDSQFDNHLIATESSTVAERGNKGPEDWRALDQASWCQYAEDWNKIKKAWILTATEREWDAVEEMLDTCDRQVEDEGDTQDGRNVTPTALPHTPVPAATQSPTPISANCDPSYPDFCIPPTPPDLNCGDISGNGFTVLQPDPYRLDGNKDGVGCQK